MVMEPLLPVTVMVTLPLFALLVTVAVSFHVPSLFGLIAYVSPVLLELALNVTLPLKPGSGVMVIV